MLSTQERPLKKRPLLRKPGSKKHPAVVCRCWAWLKEFIRAFSSTPHGRRQLGRVLQGGRRTGGKASMLFGVPEPNP